MNKHIKLQNLGQNTYTYGRKENKDKQEYRKKRYLISKVVYCNRTKNILKTTLSVRIRPKENQKFTLNMYKSYGYFNGFR